MCTVIIVVCSLKNICIPSYVLIGRCVSESSYVPILIYGLRLFIVVLHELHCLPTLYYVYALIFTDSYQITKFRPSIQSGF